MRHTIWVIGGDARSHWAAQALSASRFTVSTHDVPDEKSQILPDEIKIAVRELGFKPYIAPGLSSACVSVLQALRGQFHYGTVPIGGVCFGCRSRYTPYGLELERLPLAAQLRQRIAVSYADLKEMESQCRL